MCVKNITFILASLALVCVLCITCKKNKSVAYPFNYTEKMGGTRNWVGTDSFGFAPGTGNDIALAFAITPVNSSTVNVQGDILDYVSYSEPDQSMLFSKKGSQDSASVVYFFKADSITYYKYERVSLCCYTIRHLYSKK